MKRAMTGALLGAVLMAAGGLWAGEHASEEGHHHKAAAGQGSGGGHEAQGAKVSLRGEVLDLHCFLLHPESGQGKDHIKCAKMCMNKGLPIGFKAEDGAVYLLLGQGHDAVKSLVLAQAGQAALLEGRLVEGAPMKAIQVKSVKRLAGAAGAAAPAASKEPAASLAKEAWVCPMDGSMSDRPGRCPKCGMDLEKKKS